MSLFIRGLVGAAVCISFCVFFVILFAMIQRCRQRRPSSGVYEEEVRFEHRPRRHGGFEEEAPADQGAASRQNRQLQMTSLREALGMIQNREGRPAASRHELLMAKRRFLDSVLANLAAEKYRGAQQTCPTQEGETQRTDQTMFNESCTICMGEFILGEPLSQTPCNHLFHKVCL